METLDIMLVSSEYPPFPIAGSGMFTLNLIKELKHHNISVITPYDGIGPKNEIKGNIKINRINTLTTSLKRLLPQKHNRTFIDRRVMFSIALRKYLKSINLKNYDVLHSINLLDASFLDYNYVNSKTKSILSVNDYYALQTSWNIFKFPYFSLDLPFRYLHHNITKMFSIHALQSCNKIIANSKYTASVVRDNCKISENKIETIYRGIDLEQFREPIPKTKYSNHNILFVGGNFERKGGKYLLEAMPKITKKIPEAKLIIVGAPNKVQSMLIKPYIRNKGLEKNIKIIKYLPPAEMAKLYADANVFIMPSIIEGLGQVFMEAMAENTPVIGTNVGGIPEIITKETGILIPPKNAEQISNAILKLLSNPKMAREMGNNGKKRVQKMFSKEIMAKKILNVYKETAK